MTYDEHPTHGCQSRRTNTASRGRRAPAVLAYLAGTWVVWLPVVPVTITVLFFAGARELAGTSRLEVELPVVTRSGDAPTLADLPELLGPELLGPESPEGHRSGRLGPLMASCALWVNQSPAGPRTPLSPGDEVAVLPPVSGGCLSLSAPRKKSFGGPSGRSVTRCARYPLDCG